MLPAFGMSSWRQMPRVYPGILGTTREAIGSVGSLLDELAIQGDCETDLGPAGVEGP
jgi:hypothetical protein